MKAGFTRCTFGLLQTSWIAHLERYPLDWIVYELQASRLPTSDWTCSGVDGEKRGLVDTLLLFEVLQVFVFGLYTVLRLNCTTLSFLTFIFFLCLFSLLPVSFFPYA